MEFQRNEVQEYLDARYVGPPEGAWRLFDVPMHEKSHNVERLAVHLKGGETIVFAEGQEREAISSETVTTLTAWFALNREAPDGQDPPARSLSYAEVPEHFRWNNKDRRWCRRQRLSAAERVIGRLRTANPSGGLASISTCCGSTSKVPHVLRTW